MVDGVDPDWVAQASRKLRLGQNFLLLVPNRPDAIRDVGKIFELAPECTRAPLGRSDLISVSRFMEHKDFDYLLEAERAGEKIYFIEQLDLAMNRPPRVKPFLGYCPTWGIVSQHDQFSEAREAYYNCIHSIGAPRSESEVGIYMWSGERWQMLSFG